MIIKADAKLDMERESLTIHLDVTGETQMEHELVNQFFGKSRSLSISPAKPTDKGFQPHHEQASDDHHAIFTIYDKGVFERAKHDFENRQRKDNGQPSLEQEAAAAKEAAEKEESAKS